MMIGNVARLVLGLVEVRRPRVVREVEAWGRELAAARARLAGWLSPVTEEARLETATQLAEASARAAYLEGVLGSLQAEASALRAARIEADRVASAATGEARRLRDLNEILEANRDRVGEALKRTGLT